MSQWFFACYSAAKQPVLKMGTKLHPQKSKAKETPPIPTDPNPRNKSLFIPWLAVSITFAFSLIVAIATMLHGMAQVSLGKTDLSWWYRTLMLLSESGLALSTLGILALVVGSIRRASKAQS